MDTVYTFFNKIKFKKHSVTRSNSKAMYRDIQNLSNPFLSIRGFDLKFSDYFEDDFLNFSNNILLSIIFFNVYCNYLWQVIAMKTVHYLTFIHWVTFEENQFNINESKIDCKIQTILKCIKMDEKCILKFKEWFIYI